MALKPKQLLLLETLLANPMLTDVAAAKALGIDRETVRFWKRKEEFQELYKKRLREQWEDAEGLAQETMITLAAGGDFKASKYILDSLGYAPTQKVEAEVKTDIEINIEG